MLPSGAASLTRSGCWLEVCPATARMWRGPGRCCPVLDPRGGWRPRSSGTRRATGRGAGGDRLSLVPEVAGHPVTGGALLERGLLVLADSRHLTDATARVEVAAGRRPDGARDVALQQDPLPLDLGVGDGHGGEERLRVRVP